MRLRLVEHAVHFPNQRLLHNGERFDRLLVGIFCPGDLSLVLVEDGKLKTERRTNDKICILVSLRPRLNLWGRKSAVCNRRAGCVSQDVATTLRFAGIAFQRDTELHIWKDPSVLREKPCLRGVNQFAGCGHIKPGRQGKVHQLVFPGRPLGGPRE